MKRKNSLLAGMLFSLCLCLSACSMTSVPDLKDSVTASFDSAVVQRGDVSILKVYNASVCYEFVPQDAVTAGTVERVLVSVGDTVSEGQLLAEIGTGALSARRAKLSTDLEESREDQERELRLLEYDLQSNTARQQEYGADPQMLTLEARELTARRDYLTACLELEQQQGERELARLDEQIEGSRIYAACSGNIVTLDLQTGRQVRAGQEVLRIAKEGSEHLLCTESDSSIARTTAKCVARVGDKEYPLTLIPYSYAEFQAALTAGTVPARFSFPEDAEVTAGQGAQLTVYAREAEDALYLPLRAVYGSDTSRHGYVYRMIDGEKVHTEVTVLFRTACWAVIEGLEEGDVVYVPS